jgi:hypothetical protein
VVSAPDPQPSSSNCSLCLFQLILRKYDTRPVQTVIGSLVHIPLFILVAYSARDLIRSGNYAGLETGGFWLWTNLMEADETYALPLIASGSVFLNLEVRGKRDTRVYESTDWRNISCRCPVAHAVDSGRMRSVTFSTRQFSHCP